MKFRSASGGLILYPLSCTASPKNDDIKILIPVANKYSPIYYLSLLWQWLFDSGLVAGSGHLCFSPTI